MAGKLARWGKCLAVFCLCLSFKVELALHSFGVDIPLYHLRTGFELFTGSISLLYPFHSSMFKTS